MTPHATPPLDGLLQTLLDVSLTGVILFRPVFGADQTTVIDLAYVQLNLAAQRMLRLPERPASTFLNLYPNTIETGIFAFYRDTFLSGTAGRMDVNYQHDGLDNYFKLSAQAYGELLVVSFSDTADQPRTAVEVALREAQAREQAALAEAEIQRGELQRLFEQAPVAMAVFWGPDYVVQRANPAVLRMWGRTSAQTLGTPLFELLPEIAGQGFEELLDGVLATGVPFEAHEMPGLIDREGRRDTVYFNFVYYPQVDADGQIGGITVLATEATEQVLARQQLQQLNEELEARVAARAQEAEAARAEAEAVAQRLRHVTDSLPSTTFTTDQSGRVIQISPQWYAYTGLAPGSSIDEQWPRLIHPDDLPVIAQEFGAALAEGRPWRYEFRLLGATGRYRWFASQGVPEPLADAEAVGRPRQWFGSNLDIDDLKQAQQAQQAQEQQLNDILMALPATVATFEGEELRYTFFNETFQEFVQGRAVVGRPLAELFPEDEQQGFGNLLRGVLGTAEPFLAPEVPAYVQDPHTGERVETFLDLTYLPLRHGAEAPYGVLAFSVDVTERVRVRKQTEALQAQLLAVAQAQVEEREALYQIFEQTPAFICLLRGPQHRYEYVNLAHRQYFAGRELMGRTVAEAQPEAVAQGFIALLDGVYQSGESTFGYELPFASVAPDGTPGEPSYFDISYQALREDGQVTGISIFSFEVTERVLARRQNEALQAEVLAAAQRQAQERTTLYQVFEETPALICILRGPEHRYEYLNDAYLRHFAGRELAGRPVAEVFPETVEQGFIALQDGVYRSGETFFGRELLLTIEATDHTPAQADYYNLTYQAYRENGEIVGVCVFAYVVTDQVEARQHNEDLQAQVLAAARRQATERETFYQVFEQTPALLELLRGPNHRIEYVNPAYQRMFPGLLLVGHNLDEAQPEVRAQGFLALMDQVYQTGETYHGIDVPFTIPAQADEPARLAYFTVSYQAFREEGQIAGIFAFANDVTDQVLARLENEALQAEVLANAHRQSQERETFFRVFEQTPALIQLLRSPGHLIEYVNPAYQRVFLGRQLVGLDLAVALPELQDQGFIDIIDRVYRTGETYFGTDVPTQIAQAEGTTETRYFSFTYQAYQEDGQTAGIAVFASDVTEQVLARQEREAQRQLLFELFEEAPVAICLFRGEDYVLEVVNPPMAEMLGHPLAQLVGRPFFEALPELFNQGLPELLAEVRRTGTPFVAYERRIQLANHALGQPGYYNFTYQPLRDFQHQVSGVVCVATDVSEQVRARQRTLDLNHELSAANQQLVRTNADLDTFIYTASHDLKAPITNIEGLLTALSETLPEDARQAEPVPYLFELLQGAVVRFQLTIAQLSDIAKLQQAQQQPPEAVNLVALIEAVRLDLAPLLICTGAQLTVDVAQSPMVRFSPKNLRSIVYNLLSNAIKYHHPDRIPVVRLRCGLGPGDTVTLQVEDNGLGLSEKQQSKLFGMFQRLHTHVEGSGIGLYMVKKIVENAGGTIAVESELGVGTTFTVMMPHSALVSADVDV